VTEDEWEGHPTKHTPFMLPVTPSVTTEAVNVDDQTLHGNKGIDRGNMESYELSNYLLDKEKKQQ